jgi:hypothetical protein
MRHGPFERVGVHMRRAPTLTLPPSPRWSGAVEMAGSSSPRVG